jgi:hypothetical protein
VYIHRNVYLDIHTYTHTHTHEQALFKEQLETLIEVRKKQAIATIQDSLYGMQSWLYMARRKGKTKPEAGDETAQASLATTNAQSETSTRYLYVKSTWYLSVCVCKCVRVTFSKACFV